MPGPLPTENPQRRNAPTIPTTSLPVSGRAGRVPKVPEWVVLGEHGAAWWRWAWKLPQACAWAPGHEVMIARRAQLEDDIAALAGVEGLDIGEVIDEESFAKVQTLIRRLASLASGRLSVMKEMRELDDRLGLNPKGMAALRWKVVDDPKPTVADPAVPRLEDRRGRITNAS